MITTKVRKAAGVTENEALPAYAWPGGYPLYYYGRDNGDDLILCAECANNTDATVLAVEANLEDPDLCCDQCGGQIQCAYCD